ncbi:thermonuclease family protein [Arenibaculum pallidiluteum]|uniref:thermonuclease family protein n=1 Tax=Arenibaculum pallidiluteum TaxID=2812559 RepID=UPI001A97935F|nr:thermonuclease family protein [Arenibaculum pallidiluteum]
MTGHFRSALLLAATLAAWLPAAPCPAAEATPGPLVSEVAGAGILALEDGTLLRLAGLALPGEEKIQDGWGDGQEDGQEDGPGDAPEDTAEGAAAQAARQALAALVLGRRMMPLDPAAPVDRHGRITVQLRREDGLWIQDALLRAGHARVRTRPDERDRAAEMLAAEAEAREGRRGIWADPRFRVRSAAARPGPPERFHLVEGIVLAVGRVRDRIYLNFGTDWRTDFTAAIEARDLRAFRRAGLDAAGLAGRRVRLRGWLFERAGPAMDLTHPEQVQILP